MIKQAFDTFEAFEMRRKTMKERIDWPLVFQTMMAIATLINAIGHAFNGNNSAAVGWGMSAILWGVIIAIGRQGLK